MKYPVPYTFPSPLAAQCNFWTPGDETFLAGEIVHQWSRAQQKEMMLEDGVEFFKGVLKLRWVGFFGSKTLKRRLRAALQWPVIPFSKLPTVTERVRAEAS